MGKGKKAKPNPLPSPLNDSQNGDQPPTPVLENGHTAADGRNVEGWSPADIKTYNELLNERSKLEKEKNALEQKAERRSTERALLNQTGTNFEVLFSKQASGDFKYKGQNACCLDLANADRCTGKSDPQIVPCHHEICSRAKHNGISWTEMDTIKYYEMRIFSEKSERLKKALRKQMEVELVRIKKVEDEEAAAKARKIALLDKADREALRKVSEQSALNNGGATAADYQRDAVLEAAKQNDSELSQIKDELEDIKRQVDAGRVTSSDLRAKLDLAQAKMGEAERRNNLFRQMILEVESVKTQVDSAFNLPANLDDDLKKLCATAENAVAQAMTILKDFFSASGPEQMEDTMARLKSTLEARGPMPKNMRDSFRELENMVAESKAKGLKMDFKVDYGGLVTGDSMIDTMMALRKKMKEGSNSPVTSGNEHKLDKELVQANRDCLKVEEEAEKEMENVAEKMARDTPEALQRALDKIKNDAVAKSPIPPLSDIMLDASVQSHLDIHNARGLMEEVSKGVSDQQVDARLTSWILSKANKKPEKFGSAINTILTSLEYVTEKRVPMQVTRELRKVEKSMQAWAEKHAQAKAKASETKEATLAKTTTGVAEKLVEETIPEKSSEMAMETVEAKKLSAQSTIISALKKASLCLSSSPGAKFDVRFDVLMQEILNEWPAPVWLLSKLQRFSQEMDLDVEDDAPYKDALDLDVPYNSKDSLAMFSFVSTLYSRGRCPAMTTVLIARAIAETVRDDEKKGETDLRLLGGLLTKPECAPFEKRWFKNLANIAGTMVQIHTGILTIMERKFENRNLAACITAETVLWVVSTVLLAPVEERSVQAVDVIRFFVECLGDSKVPKEVGKGLAQLERIWKDAKSLCTVSTCHCQQFPDDRSHGRPRDENLSRSLPRKSSVITKPKDIPGNEKPRPAENIQVKDVEENPALAPDQSAENSQLNTRILPRNSSTLPSRLRQSSSSSVTAESADGVPESLTPPGHIANDLVKKCIVTSRLFLRMYDKANLRPPLHLVLALHRLESYLKEADRYGTDFSGKVLEDIRRLRDYENDEDGILCGCLRCIRGYHHSYHDIGPSKFTEDFNYHSYLRHLSWEAGRMSAVGHKEQRKLIRLAQRRARDVIDSKSSLEYLNFLANNLCHLAKQSPHPHIPFNEFMDCLRSLGSIPENFQAILDLAKARVMDIPAPEIPGVKIILDDSDLTEVDREISTLFHQLSDRDWDIFLQEEEWNKRKLEIYPLQLLSDPDFKLMMEQVILIEYDRDPLETLRCLSELIRSFEEVNIELGPYGQELLSNIGDLTLTGNRKGTPYHFRDLTQLIFGRLRIVELEIPDDFKKLFGNRNPADLQFPNSDKFTGHSTIQSTEPPPKYPFTGLETSLTVDEETSQIVSETTVKTARVGGEEDEDGSTQNLNRIESFCSAIRNYARSCVTHLNDFKCMDEPLKASLHVDDLVDDLEKIHENLMNTAKLIADSNDWDIDDKYFGYASYSHIPS